MNPSCTFRQSPSVVDSVMLNSPQKQEMPRSGIRMMKWTSRKFVTVDRAAGLLRWYPSQCQTLHWVVPVSAHSQTFSSACCSQGRTTEQLALLFLWGILRILLPHCRQHKARSLSPVREWKISKKEYVTFKTNKSLVYYLSTASQIKWPQHMGLINNP